MLAKDEAVCTVSLCLLLAGTTLSGAADFSVVYQR
jgi:hypothetical protein